MSKLNDQIIIITGASSGIGRQLAIDLSLLNNKLVLVGRNRKKLLEILSIVRKKSSSSIAFPLDVTDYPSVKKMIKKIDSTFREINILINSAGIGVNKSFSEEVLEESKAIFETNFFAVMNLIKEVLPIMEKQGSGHIVNIGSVVGKTGSPNVTSYSASKFALLGLSESLYLELKSKNIKVSVFSPASTNTNFFNNSSWSDISPEKKESFLNVTKVSREIIKAIRKDRFETIYPIRSRIIILLRNLMPFLYFRLINRMIKSRNINKDGKSSE